MAYTITVGAGESNGAGVSQTPALPAGTLTGKLLLIVTASSSTAATKPSSPTGYTLLASLDTTDPIAIYGKIAGASESAPTVNAWSSGTSACYMVAIESPTGWPAIGSILAGAVTSYQPANGAGVAYSAHTVVGTGNCLYRITEKNGDATDDTITSVALTSGYTAGGFATRDTAVGGIVLAGEMLTANTTVGSNATNATPAITTWPDSLNRAGITLEFVPQTTITVTVDDDTPSPTQAIVITKSGGNWNGTPTATLTDNNGANVAMPALTSVSGAVATLTLGAGSITNYDDSNATWELIRWNQTLTLTVTDNDGSGTDTIVIQPPVTDHFDAQGATTDYPVTGSATGDDVYIHIVSGNGEGLPALCGIQGSTVPTTFNVMCFDISADKWLTARQEVINVSGSGLAGEYADAFTDTNSTAITSHTPDTDTVGTGYRVEKDVSTSAAVSNAVDIQSNQVRINDANEGFVIDVGTTEPDFTIDWALQVGDTTKSAIVQVRRKDDTEHVHVLFRQTDSLIRINERVASTNVGVTGTNEATYTFDANTTYTLRVQVVGNQITVYVNDVQQLQVASTRDPASDATDIGVFSGSTYPIYFDNANCESDYVASSRTISFDAATYNPGDTVTVTVGGGVLANTTYTGTLNGVTATLGSKTTSGCTLTIPGYDEFDAAGAHATTGWYRNLAVQLDDGTNTPSATLQIVPDVAANFGVLGAGPYVYAPVGSDIGDECYVRVISGSGTAYPENCNIIGSGSGEVMVFDVINGAWLDTYEVGSFSGSGLLSSRVYLSVSLGV